MVCGCPIRASVMKPASANAYVIRYASVEDVPALRRLVERDAPRVFCGPALIGEIDGVPAAAVSMADGSVIADPSQPTTALRQLLRIRYDGLRARSEMPSLAGRPRVGEGGRPAPRAKES
jgi:hypothetical protein